MKKIQNYLLLLLLMFSGVINAQNFMNSVFLNAKYTKSVVWDAQRYPAYPTKGANWTLSGLQAAVDLSTRSRIDWGQNNNRYVRFSVEVDNISGVETLRDDVANSGRKYRVMLRLYEVDGRLVKTISKWGKLIGFGSGGFMYEQEGQIGTYFAAKVLPTNGSITYKADLDQVYDISAILGGSGSTNTNNTPNNTPSTNTNSTSGNNSTANIKSDFFTVKYKKNEVWDAQRSPAFPITGRDWTLSGLKYAFDINSGTTLDWGRNNDRYLMFAVEKDLSRNSAALIDDVNNSGQKYNVTLKLYESDGRLVKAVSKWGKLIGFGSGGFMYVQEGSAGTYFAGENVQLGGSITYRPDVDQIRNLSNIVYEEKTTNNPPTQNNNNSNSGSNTNTGTSLKSDFFTAKYPVSVVWDAQRSPAYPVNGGDWTLSGLKMAFDVNSGGTMDWGRNNDRYLMFAVEEDRSATPNALKDDVNNTSKKYRVTLKLYESDGRLVKVVSKWGKLIGFGSGGFMYEQEGQIGTYFAGKVLQLGGSNTYRIDLDQVQNLSAIIYQENNTSNQTNNNNSNSGSNSSTVTSLKSDFFTAKYPASVVWDAQRFPAYPVNGGDWTLSGLQMAFDVNTGGAMDWGRNNDRYLMFAVEEDRNATSDALKDDVNNTSKKYRVTLKLYESDGRLVKVVSKWGKLIGFGSGGFMYEQEGQIGTYFAGKVLQLGGSNTYRIDLDQVQNLSAIIYQEKSASNTSNQKPSFKRTFPAIPFPRR